jgi:O-antigen ligase
MSIQSGERGGWIAVPPLLLLWAVSYSRERFWHKVANAALFVSCAAVASYFLVGLIHSRVDLILSDLNSFSQGIKDTSLGIRIQQWRVALLLFLENPVFGVGPEGFLQAMPRFTEQGLLSTEAARMGNAEIHSEIFAKGAETGMFGLLSLFFIYIVPTLIFWKAARSAESCARRACLMGICLIAAFFIFGLTVEIFNLKMTASFFGLTLAVLMAIATNRTAH